MTFPTAVYYLLKLFEYNPVLCPKDNSSISHYITGFLSHVGFFFLL